MSSPAPSFSVCQSASFAWRAGARAKDIFAEEGGSLRARFPQSLHGSDFWISIDGKISAPDWKQGLWRHEGLHADPLMLLPAPEGFWDAEISLYGHAPGLLLPVLVYPERCAREASFRAEIQAPSPLNLTASPFSLGAVFSEGKAVISCARASFSEPALQARPEIIIQRARFSRLEQIESVWDGVSFDISPWAQGADYLGASATFLLPSGAEIEAKWVLWGQIGAPCGRWLISSRAPNPFPPKTGLARMVSCVVFGESPEALSALFPEVRAFGFSFAEFAGFFPRPDFLPSGALFLDLRTQEAQEALGPLAFFDSDRPDFPEALLGALSNPAPEAQAWMRATENGLFSLAQQDSSSFFPYGICFSHGSGRGGMALSKFSSAHPLCAACDRQALCQSLSPARSRNFSAPGPFPSWNETKACRLRAVLPRF